MAEQAAVVLVHGGAAGSWTWHLVVDGLQNEGVDTHAVDLPSCSAPDNSIDPHDDARFLRDVLDGISGPIVVAGNSYGGFVMSEASAGHPRVRRLVFIAAIMPKPNESWLEVIGSAMTSDDPLGMTILSDGRVMFDPEHDLAACAHQSSFAEQEWMRPHLGRPMSFGTDPAISLSRVAWETIPSTYVVCGDDRALRPDVQRLWAKERASDFVEWPTDHCPQHSHPELVVELLARLAKEV